jgi:hypothetical protein
MTGPQVGNVHYLTFIVSNRDEVGGPMDAPVEEIPKLAAKVIISPKILFDLIKKSKEDIEYRIDFLYNRNKEFVPYYVDLGCLPNWFHAANEKVGFLGSRLPASTNPTCGSTFSQQLLSSNPNSFSIFSPSAQPKFSQLFTGSVPTANSNHPPSGTRNNSIPGQTTSSSGDNSNFSQSAINSNSIPPTSSSVSSSTNPNSINSNSINPDGDAD